MDHFHIIQALCRSALANPTSALVHQIERLKNALETEGKKKEAKVIESLLMTSNKTVEMSPSKIQKSRFFMGGEELTLKTPLPVDKESSTPLAEIIFTNTLPVEPPLFSSSVGLAIESIINEWRHFDKLSNIEAHPSRSCLIYGLSGTGKTHLALWLARQINIPVVLARLDGLMSSFLGTTSRNIGNLFAFAAKYRCILLLDEFDAIAKLRNDPQEVGEIKRVVNSLLQNLDNRKDIGFTIGITNHESLLDPAIWRRFEVQIEIPTPSTEVMPSILSKFLSPLVFDENELNFLSWCIESSSGADAVSMALWLKKSAILNESIKESLVTQLRKFTLLNAGRISNKRRTALLCSDNELASILSADEHYDFKQKEIASLLGTTPSTLSKMLSKNKQL